MTGWRALQGLDLVVRALGVLLTQQVGANREVATCRLALAGGYDARLEENREVLAQLRELVFTLGLSEQARRHKRPCLFFIPFLVLSNGYSRVCSARSLHGACPWLHLLSGCVQAQVRFFPSFSEQQRESLFHTARAVVYTPQACPLPAALP